MNKLSNFTKYIGLATILLLCGCSQNLEEKLSLTTQDLNEIRQDSPDDVPLLHCAIQNLRFDVAKALILQGADVNSEDAEGKTPLFYFGLTQRDPDDYAVDFKSMGEFLIDHGADIHHRDHKGNTPLHATVENSRIAELLISKGADVNAKNNDGITPLHITAYDFRLKHSTRGMEILLKEKADVNAQDNEGLTPLHYTVKSDNYKACELLLKNGAKTNIWIARKCEGSPLAQASKEYRFDLMCLLSDTEGGVKIQAFHYFFNAIKHDDISFMRDIKRLRKKNIDEFMKYYTISPLILAVMMNKVKVAEFLISRGADINVKCELPKDYVYLGENWAEVELYAHNKWTPLQIAKHKGYSDMVKLLSKK